MTLVQFRRVPNLDHNFGYHSSALARIVFRALFACCVPSRARRPKMARKKTSSDGPSCCTNKLDWEAEIKRSCETCPKLLGEPRGEKFQANVRVSVSQIDRSGARSRETLIFLRVVSSKLPVPKMMALAVPFSASVRSSWQSCPPPSVPVAPPFQITSPDRLERSVPDNRVSNSILTVTESPRRRPRWPRVLLAVGRSRKNASFRFSWFMPARLFKESKSVSFSSPLQQQTKNVKMVVFRCPRVAWQFQSPICFPAVKRGLILES